MRIFYELIYTVPFALFLISYFFLSQKIYIYNKFLLAFLIVIAVTVLIFFFCYKKDYNKVILFAAIPSFYILLLWLIKKKCLPILCDTVSTKMVMPPWKMCVLRWKRIPWKALYSPKRSSIFIYCSHQNPPWILIKWLLILRRILCD